MTAIFETGHNSFNTFSTMSMSNLQINYTEFHQELDRFVSLLPGVFLHYAPQKLDNVRILPEILMPYDSAFRDRPEVVVRKYLMIQELLRAVLEEPVYRCVDPQYHEWFIGQKQKLEWYLMLVNMTLAPEAIQYCSQDTSVLSAGVGGMNTTVSTTLSSATLMKLRDLVDGLNAAARLRW